MTKPELKIIENDLPETGHKDGNGNGQPPTESQPANDSSYGWRIPAGMVVLVVLAVTLASIDMGLLLGLVVLSTLVLPWVMPGGWLVSLLIWFGLFLAFA